MAYQDIQVEKKGHLTTITMNRPESMNSISPVTSSEIDKALSIFENDPGAWVCIITGAGNKAFSVGNDLKYTVKHGAAAVGAELAQIAGGFGGITRRFKTYKPIIAAVNGLALGGGFEIALACDIIIASENAEFGLPEPRVGLIAGAGGVHRLPRQMPYHAAMSVILACKRMKAAEALHYGIVCEVVAGDELMSAAERWALEIMKGAPLAVRVSKECAVSGLALTLEEAMNKEYDGIKILMNSEDLKEGPMAFAEKRPPKWQGR